MGRHNTYQSITLCRRNDKPTYNNPLSYIHRQKYQSKHTLCYKHTDLILANSEYFTLFPSV